MDGVDWLKYVETRFDSQDKAVAAALASQEKAVNAALTAAKEAVSKAENAAEKRFDAVNEFRAQLSDQAAQFMPRLEAEQRIAALTEKFDGAQVVTSASIGTLSSRLDRMAGKSQGMSDGWGLIVGGVVVAAAVVGVVVGLQ